ncbi:MAG: sodium:calcium antiporter [Candidatus Micrarchaeota archaeon]
MVVFELAVLIAGLAVISFCSEKTVEYSTHIGHSLKVPPIIIGVLLVSVGTDIPEIANSIFSSYSGHGDINVGNALGSCLTQISLILGLVAILGGTVMAHRRNILVLGLCATVAVGAAAITILDGQLDRTDAALLILLYIVLIAVSMKFVIGEYGEKGIDLSMMKNNLPKTFILLVMALVGVVIGAMLVVESVINISTVIGIPEYFVSFFVIGLGTSLPELSVELAAIKKKRFGLLIGDLMGSNITDATLALGIGPLLFPTKISGEIIMPVALYVIIASVIIVGLFAWREKIDKKAAVILIGLYLLSFVFIR